MPDAGKSSVTSVQVETLERRAAMLAVVVGVGLMVAKFVAYAFTGSAAIFSDAMESIVNIVASSMAVVVLKIAHTPPDATHPYGHGKIEFLSAALEGGMICAAAGAIIVKAIHDLRTPEIVIDHIGLGLAITIGGGIVNALIGLMLLRLGRRTRSATLEADGKHLLSDFVTSLGAIVALVIVRTTGHPEADPIIALLMAAYLIIVGAKLLKQSVDMLMDKQDPEDEKLLVSMLWSHVIACNGGGNKEPTVCSFHKLRHRHTGRYHWVDFHLVVPSSTDVQRAHDIASIIEGEIEQALGEGDATAHIEPCGQKSGPCGRCGGPPGA
jgi:cation diffusion facilitator family transporter